MTGHELNDAAQQLRREAEQQQALERAIERAIEQELERQKFSVPRLPEAGDGDGPR
jgi:hypothetical protein